VTAAINLVDAAGQHLTLDHPPARIVLVGPAPFVSLHMLYMFEETKDRLKGFEAKTKQKDAFLNLIDPEFSSKIPLITTPRGPLVLTL
jgi:ABC-type Fe3+-hydroxamate transport system substrate-binding protein